MLLGIYSKDYLQNRKINVFILCCKNTVNWKREVRPISSYMLVIFSIMKNTL